MKMTHSEICFLQRGKTGTIEVVHNLEDYGLDIESAFVNFVARSPVITAKRFCNYIISKDVVNLICIPKDEFDELKRK